jgi:hypothetical protein
MKVFTFPLKFITSKNIFHRFAGDKNINSLPFGGSSKNY